MTKGKDERLTVAVTGPTGDIGRSFMRALERSNKVGRIIGMARRPPDTEKLGWKRVEYRQGDVLDRAAVDSLVEGADVVVHLAFIIFGDPEETHSVNLQGSRNVFESAAEAGVRRIVYTSSVAAYGFHPGNPEVLTEEIEPLGTTGFYYSAQKAELEGLLSDVVEGSRTEAYVFRPCIVAGKDALMLVESVVEAVTLDGRLAQLWRLARRVPVIRPVLPDPGVPFQLVHHDDVAAALRAAVLGRGRPGFYNLAGEGRVSIGQLAAELGWHSMPVPRIAVDAVGELVSRVPFMPARASWIHAFRTPVLLDCAKARRELRWRPEHDSLQTLRETAAAARRAELV